MEMFTSQFVWIQKWGVLGWLKHYPINPITIVAVVLMIGIIILIFNAKTRKKMAEESKVPGAALLILKKQNSFNVNFAEQVRVVSVNGKNATWFFYKTRPAIYLKPGENELVVYAEWAESIRKLVKTKPKTINITIDYEKIYTLYYVIELDRYLFCEGDEYEGKDWKKFLESGKIVG